MINYDSSKWPKTLYNTKVYEVKEISLPVSEECRVVPDFLWSRAPSGLPGSLATDFACFIPACNFTGHQMVAGSLLF